jgi:hypothetical protein
VIIVKLVQVLSPGSAVPRERKFSFHLGNARPHNSIGATEFIDGEKSVRLSHLPSSPDIAPSDSIRFGMLKEKLKNCPARMFDELKQEATSILRSIPEAELISVFRIWLKR